jgi:hypothetical protein
MSNPQFEIGTADQRRKIDKDGRIVVFPPYGTIDVKITEIWNDGAKIELRFEFDLGTHFALIFPGSRTLVNVELVTQTRCLAVVKFKSPPRSISIHRYRHIHDIDHLGKSIELN